ncbi:arsenite efflux ATP-binding protein ArsA [Desulfatibacillum alkenivorans DSM 16219]|jgi:anion-transporting  ArsA/GET3 family ATPase|uniref:arsenite-transporting ATPase n=1 Tax=Desulfatibacillum alkenivorans DSM 16219 TaxID=1121393 RepID=A0A1M6GD22_9BACT|nr:ArsA-related P-loop ATPase [Desulfatibacillum alkenivorans]SHJ07825.1 arsenite efflux ATP-binding protein ArsA [Desulfatibacillum alkenivorans DSM 16219]
MQLSDLVAEKHILVCCGSGGVGKTTISASLALSAAMAGRKVLVCTIDPAKRLADSLGLKELGNEEARIPDEAFDKAGVKPKGELWGMMLDSKRTFDDLIERISPNEETSRKILENGFYQNITTALAGSQEFSAMEKLYELAASGKYDLIVLDTPPSRHALDFLDAPNKMTAFLDAKVIQWVLKPYLTAGKMGFKFVNRTAKAMFSILEKATGKETLADIADFFLVFEGLYDGFKARAARVRELMEEDGTAFLLVTSPQSGSLSEADFFVERIEQDGMALGGVIFNRVHTPPTDLTSREAAALGEKAASSLKKYQPAVEALVANLRLFILLAEADKRAIDSFLTRLQKGVGSVRVPYLLHDVHDIATLLDVASYLKLRVLRV